MNATHAKKLIFDNVRKKRCDNCIKETDMKFDSIVVSSLGDVCGGTPLYQIVPKKGITKVRLHHILHWMMNYYVDYKFIPIHSWEQIWDACSGWHEPNLVQKHKGKIQRGIMYSDGNSTFASVQDTVGNLYAIVGVWGG